MPKHWIVTFTVPDPDPTSSTLHYLSRLVVWSNERELFVDANTPEIPMGSPDILLRDADLKLTSDYIKGRVYSALCINSRMPLQTGIGYWFIYCGAGEFVAVNLPQLGKFTLTDLENIKLFEGNV